MSAAVRALTGDRGQLEPCLDQNRREPELRAALVGLENADLGCWSEEKH
jgi:hypothetical protein